MNKYTEKDIAVVVPSYNNLKYLQLLYSSVRDASSHVQLIMYADGCTDGTWEWMRKLPNKDMNIMVFNQETRMGHTFLYDWGFQKTDRSIIGILHADMVIHQDFFKNILSHINNKKVVCGTCVEPPLHPPGREKHIFNAGLYPEDFNQSVFNDFCETITLQDSHQTYDGIFAPWFLLKEDYDNYIGSHDSRFAPYGYEDADLFTRMALSGLTFVQSRDALVYHFTQRGHKWTAGIGVENDGYQQQMMYTHREYIRKFGTDPLFDEYHKPIPAPKYDIGIVMHNTNLDWLWSFEPYFSTVYTDISDREKQMYVKSQRTVDNLNEKLKSIDTQPFNNVVVHVDCRKIQSMTTTMQFIFNLPLILQQTNDTGTFEFGEFTITINSLEEVSI